MLIWLANAIFKSIEKDIPLIEVLAQKSIPGTSIQYKEDGVKMGFVKK